MIAALLGAAAFGASAVPAEANPASRLRDSLFKRPGGQVAGPPLARFVSEEGRVFTLDRTQATPMLKFAKSLGRRPVTFSNWRVRVGP